MQDLFVAGLVAIDRPSLAAQAVHQLIQFAGLLDGVVGRDVTGLGYRRVHPALRGGLDSDVFFRGQVHGVDEVVRKGLTGMSLLELLDHADLLLMDSQAALAQVGPEVEGFDAG